MAEGFKKREATRPIIVAIVAEGLELSDRYPDQVLTPLSDSRAALYVIGLGMRAPGMSDDARYLDVVLDKGPRVSGGTRSQLLTGTALPGKLQQLGNLLTQAYRVTYARPNSLIPPEKVTVTSRRTNLTAHGTPARKTQGGQ